MPYTQNPRLPRLRAQAVALVRQGQSVTDVARHFGYTKSAVSKWCRKVPAGGAWLIPTRSARPRHHPNAVSPEIKERIVALRRELHGRCGEVIHQHLLDEGRQVSLRTVQRVLDRAGLLKKRSPWKRLHRSPERPLVAQPGDLVQLDTIHFMKNQHERLYVYTLLDVCSRWAYARASARATTWASTRFVREAQAQAPFAFRMLQSDHGSEFSQHFSERVKLAHRHSRVRQPNDNAHLERFNRTLQDECLRRLPPDVRTINRLLPRYLTYYNDQRKHLGLNLLTPTGVLANCFQGAV